jgi:hypothetical protein
MSGTEKNKMDFPTQVFAALHEIDKKVDLLRDCLLGNEFKKDGLCANDAKQDRRITRLERFMWICTGGLTVVNFVVLYLIKH